MLATSIVMEDVLAVLLIILVILGIIYLLRRA